VTAPDMADSPDPFRTPVADPAPTDPAHTGPLQAAITRQMQARRIPSLVIAVVRHDRPLHVGVHGLADLATGTPATAETAYLWFSMTKIATATAAMALVDAGILDLDVPVTDYLPEYALSRAPTQPTVRHLLSHTAGLANPPPIRWVHPASAPALDPALVLAGRLRHHRRLRHRVGGPAHYSNLGYLMLGQVMAAAAGEPVFELVTRLVLRPAGMSRTGYTWPPALASAPDVATGYLRVPAAVDPLVRAMLPRGIVGRRHADHLAFRPFLVDGAAYGGLVGDVLDVARLAALHLGGGALAGRRVISPQAARQMRSATHAGPSIDVGLGWFRPVTARDAAPAYVEHPGGGGGYHNVVRLYPDLDLAVAIMTNTTSGYDHHSICTAAAETAW
jgi:CubicO group peptidase (beta-lactamase class C family)